MNTDFVKSLGARDTLNFSEILTTFAWLSESALEKAANARDTREVAAIERDLDLFSRTRFKSSRLVKLIRDAEDEI